MIYTCCRAVLGIAFVKIARESTEKKTVKMKSTQERKQISINLTCLKIDDFKFCLSYCFETTVCRSRLNTVETNVIHSSISDDRSRLVVVKSTSIDLWNMESWKQCGEATCRKNEVFATAHFCNEHKYLLVTLSNQDLGVYVWDLTTLVAAVGYGYT